MQQWEYYWTYVWVNDEDEWVVADEREPLQHFLDRMGRSGWEMVGTVLSNLTNQWTGVFSSQADYNPPHLLYFKRPRA